MLLVKNRLFFLGGGDKGRVIKIRKARNKFSNVFKVIPIRENGGLNWVVGVRGKK